MREPKLPTWTTFQKAEVIPKTEYELRALAKLADAPLEEVRRIYEDLLKYEQVYLNSRYQVTVRRIKPYNGEGPDLVHLSIKRLDKRRVGIERFRDFQRIKNELVGPECEGVELYPAESRLVDGANQYHLYVVDSPTFRWNLGFKERSVSYKSGAGVVQTPKGD